ncbi:MAG TPA: HAMP domain-containing sensor histidine kinase [Mycobacteriales bacterium]|nr:HAMP domain-containing sensor histidine kinase [Mycobacteriales bacterium]
MRVWRRFGLRARLTIIATAALAVGIAAGSLLLLHGFATSRVHAIDSSNRTAASDIAGLVGVGAVPPTLPAQAGQSVQVLTASGAVVAVSPGTSHTLPLVSVATAVWLAHEGPRSIGVEQVAATGLNRVFVRAQRSGNAVEYVVVTESLQDEHATLHSLGRFVAIAAPILLLIVGTTLWLLLGRALGAVTALGRGAEAINDPGAGARLPLPDSEDEIRGLAITLNAMLERLDAAGIRERQFVADVAHELRSPIAAIRTQLEVGLGHPDPDTRRELLAGTLDEVDRLGALVDDLLELVRMESDAKPTTARVDIAALAGVTGGPAYVTGNARALTRAVDNMVANANRHASHVRVSVSHVDPDTIEVAVDDDGPGVAPEDRTRIFERFVRLDDARARDHGGSGLGLAIARATAITHGGTISVGESDLGGASFVLRLPAAGATP